MQASKKITIAIVSIYSLVFLALAIVMFTQAKKDVDRETFSAMLMAEALTRQNIPVAQLKTALELDRHLSTTMVAATAAADSLVDHTSRSTTPSIVYQDPVFEDQRLLISPNPDAEVEEIQATVLQVFGIFILSLFLTLKSLRVAIRARLKSLHSLSQALTSIPEGHYHVKVDKCDINEINDLIQHYNTMADSLAKKHSQVLRLRARVADLMENERRSLAREIHDNLGQLVTGISVQSYMLKQQSHNQIFVRKYAAAIVQQCEDIQSGFRVLTNQLYPVALSRVGLIAGLQDLCEHWQEIHNIPVSFNGSGDLVNQIDRDTHIYRIAQEALNNVAKHARATKVSMSAQVEANQLILQVKDNGVGLQQETNPEIHSLGLESMRDRASLIHAQFDIEPWAQGVVIRLVVPIETNQKEKANDQYIVSG